MIKDRLIHSKNYYNLSKYLQKGFSWLEENNLDKMADGKYEIDGENIYASIQTYETKAEANYESHRKYIDIQYMINGIERVGVTDISNCHTVIKYDESKDLEFYKIYSDEEFLDLATGEFLVLFPNDAHKPSITKEKKQTVKKVVVKVLVN